MKKTDPLLKSMIEIYVIGVSQRATLVLGFAYLLQKFGTTVLGRLGGFQPYNQIENRTIIRKVTVKNVS